MKAEIEECIEVLKSGGLILYPTDTIWGIGCDATNEEATQKIFQLKRRTDSKSMIVLLDNEARLAAYIREVPQQAYELMEYSEKPLTLVLPGAKNLAKNIIAADESIGIRITKDEFCRNVIQRFRKPIVSTSANISGENPPLNFSEVSEEIKSGVDYVVRLRQNESQKGFPSQIIQLGVGGEIKFLRN